MKTMFMYLVVLLVLFFPILLPPEGTLVFGSDIHRSYHYFRQFFHDAIQNGIFPWWNPYLFSGEPLIANPSLSFWYPPNWLFAVLPYRYVYSWLIVSHVVLSMVGMFWLAKKWMEPLPAWLAGLVFGMSGFFMGRIWEGHIELIAAAAWMPWVVWAFTRRGVVLAGAIFALQLFAGYQTMALFTLEAVLFLTVYLCFKTKSFRPLVRMTIAVGIGIGLAGLQIIPAQEFFSQSIRTYSLPYSWAAFGSYSWENLKQMIYPFILGGPVDYVGPSPNYGELSAYVGIVPILLTLLAIVFLFRKKLIISVLLLIAMFGLWVSLGKNAPVDLNHFLWKTVPVYTYIRIPARHLILFVFSMSALAGMGLSLVRHSLAKLILVVVITVDLVWFARHFIALKPDPETRHNKELVLYLQKNLELARVLPNFNVGIGTRDALDFDAPMGYGIYSASGYDPSILRKYYEFIAAANGIKDPDVQQNDVQIPPLNLQSRAVDFLNIKYVFVPSWRDSIGKPSDRYRLVLEDVKRDYWRLYENRNVIPRFYLVPRLTTLPDRETIAAAIREGNVDFQKTVLVVGAKKRDGDCKSALPPVSVSMYSPNTIRLTTSADCDSYLASSEVVYPGWTATIDGRKVDILEGNLAFRTLSIPAGKHTIVMQYQPRIFVIGLLVSVATAVGCMFWMKKRKSSDLLVVVDRDGTIITNDGYFARNDNWREDLRLNMPVVNFLRNLQSNNKATTIVASNQSGVARGDFDEKRVGEVNDAINVQLKKHGVRIDCWQFCSEVDAAFARAHPDVSWKKPYVKNTTKRKPSAAMVMDGLDSLGKTIGDFDEIIVLGNSDDDQGLARTLGARWIDVRKA